MRIILLSLAGALTLGCGLSRGADGPRELAAQIDRRIEEQCKAKGAVLAPPSSDAEYLRRVYLDLAGRIPRVAEAREFLEDDRADKRYRLVEELLRRPTYANHASAVWRAFLLPQTVTNPQLQSLGQSMEAWLRPRLKGNVGYDRMVRELLTAPLPYNYAEPARGNEPSAVAFYEGNDLKAETLGSTASRLFLGVKLECAQCHDHPFAEWKQTQFWEFAAFFAPVPPDFDKDGLSVRPARPAALRYELPLPDGGKRVSARFLDGSQPRFDGKTDPRQVFAAWLTSPKNPYFTRTAVNRIWAQYMGVGLIEPLDDYDENHVPSHPELLDELVKEFAGHGYDVQYLIRAILASKAYQRTSAESHASQKDPHLYARRGLKMMAPEQLFDSLSVATGYRESVPAAHRGLFGLERRNPRAEFFTKFAGAGGREAQTSILQALALMNGKFVGDMTSPERGEVLAAVLDAPFLDRDAKIETLYLAALSRRPTGGEQKVAQRLLERHKGDANAALADLFWALLNGHEFILNH